MKLYRWFLGFFLIVSLLFINFLIFKISLSTKLTLFLLLCFFLSLYRIIRGPTPADRSVAVDIIGIVVVGFCAIEAFFTSKSWYMDIAIAWSLQSFIGVLALAKFLEGRHFDD